MVKPGPYYKPFPKLPTAGTPAHLPNQHLIHGLGGSILLRASPARVRIRRSNIKK